MITTYLKSFKIVHFEWCKFDDDVVSRAKAKDAIIANYGGDDSETPNKTYTSAYMLVYVRESTISNISQNRAIK